MEAILDILAFLAVAAIGLFFLGMIVYAIALVVYILVFFVRLGLMALPFILILLLFAYC